MSALLRRRRRRGATARVLRDDGDGAASLSPWVGRTLRFCGTLLALGGIAWGGWRGVDWMLREGEFPLRQVHVDGDLRNLGPEDAEAAVRPYLGRNFFRLDMGSLHTAFADNPWVQSVAVSRRWPDTVEVRFVERVPFAHWGRDEMIDTGAARFRPQKIREPHEWPNFDAPDGHEALLMRVYGDTGRALAPLGLKVVRVQQDARGAWTLTLDTGLELRLGREAYAERLARFIEVWPRVLAAQAERIAGVDLRYLNGFAVRWKAPSAEPGTHGRTRGAPIATAPATARSEDRVFTGHEAG